MMICSKYRDDAEVVSRFRSRISKMEMMVMSRGRVEINSSRGIQIMGNGRGVTRVMKRGINEIRDNKSGEKKECI